MEVATHSVKGTVMRRRVISSSDLLKDLPTNPEPGHLSTSNGMVAALGFASRLHSIALEPYPQIHLEATEDEREHLLNTASIIPVRLKTASVVAIRMMYGEVEEKYVRDLRSRNTETVICEVEMRTKSRPEHRWTFHFQGSSGKLVHTNYFDLTQQPQPAN